MTAAMTMVAVHPHCGLAYCVLACFGMRKDAPLD
jgi:hypothetical protein